MAFLPKYTINQTIMNALRRIDNIKEHFENKTLSPTLLASLHKTAKITSVHFSTKIEGNNLTLKEVEQVLYSGVKDVIGKPHTRDEYEVRAYYNAFSYMEKHLENQNDLTEDFIQTVHSKIEQSQTIIPYRDNQNAIYNSLDGTLVYLPPEATDVPVFMEELVHWVNDNITILPVPIVAGLFHYQFVTIHPYYDGNGRTARLITSYLMRKHGYGLKGIYSLEEYYAKDLTAYYQALATHPHHNYYYGRNEADLTSWLEYFLTGVAEAFTQVSVKADEEKSKGWTTDKSPLIRDLDVRQRKALELFTEFSVVTAEQLADYIGLSSGMARFYLRQWVKSGFVQLKNTSKKSRTYCLTSEYEALVQR